MKATQKWNQGWWTVFFCHCVLPSALSLIPSPFIHQATSMAISDHGHWSLAFKDLEHFETYHKCLFPNKSPFVTFVHSLFLNLYYIYLSLCVCLHEHTHTHIPQCVHTRFFLPPSVPSLNSGLGARAFTLWAILRTLLLQFFHIKLQIYVLSSTRQSIHRERGGERETHTHTQNISFHHKELSVVLESVNIRLRKNNKNKSSL